MSSPEEYFPALKQNITNIHFHLYTYLSISNLLLEYITLVLLLHLLLIFLGVLDVTLDVITHIASRILLQSLSDPPTFSSSQTQSEHHHQKLLTSHSEDILKVLTWRTMRS